MIRVYKFSIRDIGIANYNRKSRTSHCENFSKGKQKQNIKVVDVVKDHIQVQSNSKTVELNKSYYQARGPFQFKTVLGDGSYEVQQYNEPYSEIRKYKSKYSYLLPPDRFPHISVDTMDVHFFNINNRPQFHHYKNQ